MTYRGYFALNAVEFANSSRVAAHLGRLTPISDDQIWLNPAAINLPQDTAMSGLYSDTYPAGPETTEPGLYGTGALLDDGSPGLYYTGGGTCSLTEDPDHAGLYTKPVRVQLVRPLLYRPPNGARRYGPGLYQVSDCWAEGAICGGCKVNLLWDDTWTGLSDFLNDGDYRPEVAPWFDSEIPESGEFGGVWVMAVTGLDTTKVERPITETVGAGAVAGPYRDASRSITFDAVLIGCTNAGVNYGLKWLTCQLRSTNTSISTTLRYLTAHPGDTAADPTSLVREISGAVLTAAPEIKEQYVTGTPANRQANIYRVSWSMTCLNPYAYLPGVEVDVDWDTITRQPINWIHAADCRTPEDCTTMPVMFSTDCVPETIAVVDTPPPVCGGCLPVYAIDKYMYTVPTQTYAFTCRETAVSMVITNTGDAPLTLQAFWRVCDTDVRCEDNQWPLQVSGLPAGAELHLDGTTGQFWAFYDGRVRRPIGVVGTPNGAPWIPPVINREICWDFVVQTASTAEFTVSMTLADREP